MYKNIEVIRLEDHKASGFKRVDNFFQAKEITSAPITVNEYYEACKHYPILFAKDSQGAWTSLVLLGLDKENSFVEADGKWKKNCHIPAFIARYPFLFIEENNQLVLTFEASANIAKSEAGEDYFFEEDGSYSPFLKQLVSSLQHTQNFNKITQEFIKTLNGLGILEESSISGKTAEGKDISVGGFFIIKEEKLLKLKQKEEAKLCKKGYTQLITAHLISISNIQKLLNL